MTLITLEEYPNHLFSDELVVYRRRGKDLIGINPNAMDEYKLVCRAGHNVYVSTLTLRHIVAELFGHFENRCDLEGKSDYEIDFETKEVYNKQNRFRPLTTSAMEGYEEEFVRVNGKLLSVDKELTKVRKWIT